MNPSNNQEILISADSHVLQVPDLWEKPLAKTFGDRAPRVYFDDRRQSWMFGRSSFSATRANPIRGGCQEKFHVSAGCF